MSGAAQSLSLRLVAARDAVAKAHGDYTGALADRDAVIREADRSGSMTRAEIARLAGVERQRVGQIVDGT